MKEGVFRGQPRLWHTIDRMVAIVAVGLVGLMVACQGSATSASSGTAKAAQPMPGAAGKLSFAKNGELWTVEPSSGASHKLVSLPPESFYGTIASSPDGALVAYGVYQQGRDNKDLGGVDLYTMSSDGSNKRLLLAHEASGVFFGDPFWAPDGRAIYFTRRSMEGGERIERVASDGTGRTTVVSDGALPSLSLDGQQLAYVTADKNFVPTMWVSDADGSHARRVAGSPQFQALAAMRFSPDGTRIVFAAIAASNSSPPAGSRSPWDALAAWIRPSAAYAHPVRIPWDLWLVNTDRTGLRRLTDQGDEITVPAWSPDGKWIAFSSELGVYVIEVDGQEPHLVTQDNVEGGLAWLKG